MPSQSTHSRRYPSGLKAFHGRDGIEKSALQPVALMPNGLARLGPSRNQSFPGKPLPEFFCQRRVASVNVRPSGESSMRTFDHSTSFLTVLLRSLTLSSLALFAR
jgi:hypothetical protein